MLPAVALGSGWSVVPSPNPPGGVLELFAGVVRVGERVHRRRAATTSTARASARAVGGAVERDEVGSSLPRTSAGSDSFSCGCRACRLARAPPSATTAAAPLHGVGGAVEREELGHPDHAQPSLRPSPLWRLLFWGVVRVGECLHRCRQLLQQGRPPPDVCRAVGRDGLGDPAALTLPALNSAPRLGCRAGLRARAPPSATTCSTARRN